MNCFVSGAPDVHSYPGYAKSISAEAACLLTTRPMLRGEPIEAAVGPSEHLAGLITFCRHISAGIYEVGVRVMARGDEPILTGLRPDWVGEALRETHGSVTAARRTA